MFWQEKLQECHNLLRLISVSQETEACTYVVKMRAGLHFSDS